MILKRSQLQIIFFGVILAVLIFILKYIEYMYTVGNVRLEIYIGLISLLFTVIGLGLGYNLINKRNADITELNVIDENLKASFKFNNREYEILQLLAEGLSNKEISEHLFIAIPTVKTHTSNLYSKLEVKNRTQAVVKAQSLKLI